MFFVLLNTQHCTVYIAAIFYISIETMKTKHMRHFDDITEQRGIMGVAVVTVDKPMETCRDSGRNLCVSKRGDIFKFCSHYIKGDILCSFKVYILFWVTIRIGLHVLVFK